MNDNQITGAGSVSAYKAIYRESAQRFLALVLREVADPRSLDHWVDRELANIENAFAYAEALGSHRDLPHAVARVQSRLNARGQIQAGLRMIELGLRSAQKARDHVMCRRLLYDLGQAHMLLGNVQTALATFQRGASISRQAHDAALHAAHLGGMAAVALSKGEVSTARRRIVRACALSASLPESDYLVTLTATRGSVHRAQNEIEEAIRCYETALVLSQKRGNERSQIGLHASLGGLMFSRGNLAPAKQHIAEGIALSERIGAMEYAALLHWTLGNTQLSEAQFDLAEATLRKGLALGERAGQLDTVAGILISLGVGVSQANTPDALDETSRLWQRGLRLARELDQQERMCLLLNNLAELAWLRNQPEQAHAYLDEALQVARRINSVWEVASVLIQKGRMCHAVGNWSAATRALKSARDMAQTAGYSELIIDAELEMIKLRMSRRRQAHCVDDARRLLVYAETRHPAKAEEIRAWLRDAAPA